MGPGQVLERQSGIRLLGKTNDLLLGISLFMSNLLGWMNWTLNPRATQIGGDVVASLSIVPITPSTEKINCKNRLFFTTIMSDRCYFITALCMAQACVLLGGWVRRMIGDSTWADT